MMNSLWRRRSLCQSAAFALLGSGRISHAATAESGPTPIDQARFILPFHLLNGYILIDARIGSTAGRLMFDTGTEFSFFFNNQLLPLAKDELLARGQTASGQALELYRQLAPLETLELPGGLQLRGLPAAPHADFGFLAEGLGLRFLGTMGHGFNRHYEFAIDYHSQVIEFRALTASTYASLAAAAPTIATLPFTPTGAEGKMPFLRLGLGRHTLMAEVDTGNQGSLELTADLRQQLERDGLLRVQPGLFINGQALPYLQARLTGLPHRGRALAPVYNLQLRMGSRNRLGLGYQFLKHYVSVWNYQTRQITLLAP